ncbi:unnamed protein product [Wuchereria bancrofti]|uniref:Uncharacterized protein n=1 Tax=Wuchereria bancrofti TaxID=6293 RepID=A0A3P7ENE2_WUCBA|nr:unnamed protein product [Wuchereria bancrofti]
MEANSKRSEDSVARSVNMQGSVIMKNTDEEKLIGELIEKLKHSDEKNQELRKALHTVDEQCEKLVRSFQELKLRYEEKERNLALSASMSRVVTQSSSQYGRSDLETEHSIAEKDHRFLSQKLLVNV